MDFPCHTITKNAEETKRFGEAFGHSLLVDKRGVSRVLCLWGDLGSGKTTFVQGFARGLNIASRLLSPTFIIVRRYQIFKTSGYFYHLDLYRIKETNDALAVGFTEIISETNQNAIVAIEWPERLGVLLPHHRIDVLFEVLPSGYHSIKTEEL